MEAPRDSRVWKNLTDADLTDGLTTKAAAPTAVSKWQAPSHSPFLSVSERETNSVAHFSWREGVSFKMQSSRLNNGSQTVSTCVVADFNRSVYFEESLNALKKRIAT